MSLGQPLRHHLLGAGVLLATVVSSHAVASLPAINLSERVSVTSPTPSPEPSNPDFAATLEEAISAHVRDVAARYGLPEGLLHAIITVESGLDPRAVSPRGARGLMQLMPVTAGILRVKDSFDPRENIEGGARHLRHLMDRFDNDLRLVLAAYNAGERAVVRYRGVPPYRETREYIVRVLSFVERTPDPSHRP